MQTWINRSGSRLARTIAALAVATATLAVLAPTAQAQGFNTPPGGGGFNTSPGGGGSTLPREVGVAV